MGGGIGMPAPEYGFDAENELHRKIKGSLTMLHLLVLIIAMHLRSVSFCLCRQACGADICTSTKRTSFLCHRYHGQAFRQVTGLSQARLWKIRSTWNKMYSFLTFDKCNLKIYCCPWLLRGHFYQLQNSILFEPLPAGLQANIKVVGSATPRLLFRDGRHFLPAAESMRAVKGQPSRVASAEESDLPEDVSSSQVAWAQWLWGPGPPAATRKGHSSWSWQRLSLGQHHGSCALSAQSYFSPVPSTGVTPKNTLWYTPCKLISASQSLLSEEANLLQAYSVLCSEPTSCQIHFQGRRKAALLKYYLVVLLSSLFIISDLLWWGCFYSHFRDR